MERRIYTPTEYLEDDITTPVIFLGGPIQGAPDWHSEAIKIIHSQNPNIIIASPKKEYKPGEFEYDEQVDWESYHLEQAALTGAIMFWLAKEIIHIPERAYAQTSRGELFDWKNRKGKMVIGIEKGFSGERYIRRRFSQDRSDIRILDNLQQTCETTLELITPN